MDLFWPQSPLSACMSCGNRMMTPGKGDRGISLVELLIAIALGGLLTGLLTNVLGGVRTGWSRMQEAAATTGNQMGGVQFLFSSLSGAFMPDLRDPNTWFHGTRDRIEYLSAPPDAEKSRGRVKVKLYVADRESGSKALMAQIEPAVSPDAIGNKGLVKVIPLLMDIETVAFSFSDMRDGQLSDVGQWDDARRLPKMVRVELVFAGKNIKPVHLMIAPRRSVSGACVFDMISLGCRT